MNTYDPAAAADAARAEQIARLHQEAPVGHVCVKDPLPYCIYTTVAFIAWFVSPPIAVAFFAALGLRKYWRAWRAGLHKSDCLLRDTRLVMVYLGLLFSTGLGVAVWRFVTWL